jgi:hypothetical protein
MVWHVIHEDRDGRVQSRAARSRDLAIHVACELLQQSNEVRWVIGPNGSVIERAELRRITTKVGSLGSGEPLSRRNDF